MKKKFVSWKEIDKLTDKLVRKYRSLKLNCTSVYGIPRGGLVVGVILSHKLDLPLVLKPEEKSLVVDDICDSGFTLSKYKNHYCTATIHCKRNTLVRPLIIAETIKNDIWIVYPWETVKTSKIDYKFEGGEA